MRVVLAVLALLVLTDGLRAQDAGLLPECDRLAVRISSFGSRTACADLAQAANGLRGARDISQSIEDGLRDIDDVLSSTRPRCGELPEVDVLQRMVLLTASTNPLQAISSPLLRSRATCSRRARIPDDQLQYLRELRRSVQEVRGNDLIVSINRVCAIASALCPSSDASHIEAITAAQSGDTRPLIETIASKGALAAYRPALGMSDSQEALPIARWISEGSDTSTAVLSAVASDAANDLLQAVSERVYWEIRPRRCSGQGCEPASLVREMPPEVLSRAVDRVLRESMLDKESDLTAAREDVLSRLRSSQSISFRVKDDAEEAQKNAATTLRAVDARLREIEIGIRETNAKLDEFQKATADALETHKQLVQEVRNAREALRNAGSSATAELRRQVAEAERRLTSELEASLKAQREAMEAALVKSLTSQLTLPPDLVNRFGEIPGIAKDIQSRVASFTEAYHPSKIADTFKAKLTESFGEFGASGAGGFAAIGATVAVAAIAERKAARRHKELMRALGQIQATLAEMQRTLARIETTLNEVNTKLVAIQQSLDDISQRIDLNAAVELEHLQRLRAFALADLFSRTEACATTVHDNLPARGSMLCGGQLASLVGAPHFALCRDALTEYNTQLSTSYSDDDERLASSLLLVGAVARAEMMRDAYAESATLFTRPVRLPSSLLLLPEIDSYIEANQVEPTSAARSARAPRTMDRSSYDADYQLATRFVTATSAYADASLRAGLGPLRGSASGPWFTDGACDVQRQLKDLQTATQKAVGVVTAAKQSVPWSLGIPQGMTAPSLMMDVLSRERAHSRAAAEKAPNAGELSTAAESARQRLADVLASAHSFAQPFAGPDGRLEALSLEVSINLGRVMARQTYLSLADSDSAAERATAPERRAGEVLTANLLYALHTSTGPCESCLTRAFGGGWSAVSSDNDGSCATWASVLGGPSDGSRRWCLRPSNAVPLPLPSVFSRAGRPRAGQVWRESQCARFLNEATTPASLHCGGNPHIGAFTIPLPTPEEFRRSTLFVPEQASQLMRLEGIASSDLARVSAVRSALLVGRLRTACPPSEVVDPAVAAVGSALIGRFVQDAGGSSACMADDVNEQTREMINCAWGIDCRVED